MEARPRPQIAAEQYDEGDHPGIDVERGRGRLSPTAAPTLANAFRTARGRSGRSKEEGKSVAPAL